MALRLNHLLLKTLLRQQTTPVLTRWRSSTVTASSVKDEEFSAAKPFHLIPGPKMLPVLGNALEFLPVVGRYKDRNLVMMMNDLYDRYGKIVKIRLGINDFVFLYDPDEIERMYRNEGQWPTRIPISSFTYYRDVTRKDFFQGISGTLTTQGEEWHTFRSKVQQPMMQPKTAKLYVGPIDEVAIDFVERMRSLKNEKNEMPDNFFNELCKWSLESISMVTLDTRLGVLNPNLSPESEPQKMIDSVQTFFDASAILELRLPFWRMFSTPTWKKFVISMDYISEVSSKYINQAVERLKAKPVDDDREPTLLERLLARDTDPRYAIVMALDMMMAGIDTTSVSVAVALYFLAKNPDKQEKLYEEIQKILPSKDTKITSERLEDMKYLKACVKESMRISPVASGNGRILQKDMAVLGFQVPKGAMVLFPHMVLSNRDEYFPEAKKFIPERWLKDRQAKGNETSSGCPALEHQPHPFVSLPFSYGPRMCLGRRFAELEILTLVAKVVQSFRVEYHYGEMKYKCEMLNCPADPLKFRLLDRE